MSKDFDKWNRLKKELHVKDVSNLFFKPREVWFCSLGLNIGYEQDGKNNSYERPVLIVRKFNRHVFWGVPLSTKNKPGNKHYLPLKHNGLVFSAILSQLRLYSVNRLTRKMYVLDIDQFSKVTNSLHKELMLDMHKTSELGSQGDSQMSEILHASNPLKKSDPTDVESSEPEGHCTNIITKPTNNSKRKK